MKKLILLAAAVMALASCTKTKVTSIDEPQEIAFKKIEGAMTKAPISLEETIPMGVYALIHGETNYYFENLSFGYDGTASAWVTNPKQYWPLQDALDFVVYAPHAATPSPYNHVYETITFNVPANNTTDYMYGEKYYDNEGSGYTKQEAALSVNLKHALALIEVNISATTSGIVTLQSMTLNDIKESGMVSYNYDTETFSQTYTQTGDPATDKEIDYSFPIDESEKALTSTKVTKSIYVMPNQTRTTLTLTYTLANHANNLTVNIDLDNSGKWVNGNKYIYNISITPYEIKFAPTEEPWIDNTVNPTL